MKKIIFAIAVLLGIAVLSLMAASQLSGQDPLVETESTFTYINPALDLKETSTCTTTFFEEMQPVYGNCTFYLNSTSCLNASGPNTTCNQEQSAYDYQCQTGTSTVTKNSTICTPNKEFILEFKNETTTILRKRIDYSDWGPCITDIQDYCLIVTCVSLYDGAHNGQFTDCRGGKTCQRFEICDDSIRTAYKNSLEEFVENDPTFYYKKLQIEEEGP